MRSILRPVASLVIGALALAAAVAGPRPAAAEGCRLAGPFVMLRELVEQQENEDLVGDCTNDPATEADGDLFQSTDTGLLVLRSRDGRAFFTNGNATWSLGDDGLSRQSNAADPPRDLEATIGFAPAVAYLFVAQATGGTLQPGAEPGTLELTLLDPSPAVIYFSDRPHRQAGDRTLANFVQTWDAMGFRDLPPNAAIVLNDGQPTADVLIAVLQGPQLSSAGDRLTFQVQVLPASDREGLAVYNQRADAILPESFGVVSLFIDSVPPGAVIAGCRLEPKTQCPGVNLNRLDLSGAQLRQGYFRGGVFELTSLQNADLRGAVLSASNLRGANLRGADLTGARLAGADLTNADLRGAKLDRADLRNAKLTNADLRGATIMDAQALGAVFADANLSEAVDFSRTDLTNANLRGNRADGARLGTARLCNTTLPNGTIDNSGCPLR